MEYLDYIFDRNSNFGSSTGVVNRKIKLINIFYPNLIRQNSVLISSRTNFIRNSGNDFQTSTLTWEERDYTLEEFVNHINQFITNNFTVNDLRMEIVNGDSVRWVSSSGAIVTWFVLVRNVAEASFFSPTEDVNQVVIQRGVTTASWIPDLRSGISNLEIRFSDNNLLHVPWVGSYLSQTVYTFHEPIILKLNNANRVEIRAAFGGADRHNILTTPLRRLLRIGFVEVKE